MRTSFLSGASLAVAGAIALWSCGGSGASSSPAAPSTGSTPQTVTVNIVASSGNQAYKPNPVSARSGDTVMFKNNDSTMHHIVMDDGSFDLGEVTPGGTSKGLTLKSANAANYHCTIHSSMVGSINGQSAPEPPPCNDPYGYGC
jgi:plastocyanin